MVVIRPGERTEHVQSLVVVERKLDEGLAPIHPLLPEEKTAAIWERVFRPENATTKSVQVNYSLIIRLIGHFRLTFDLKKRVFICI